MPTLISIEILTGMQSRLKDCNSVILYVEVVSNVGQSRHETLGKDLILDYSVTSLDHTHLQHV